MSAPDLPSLLAAGERAAFFGRPADAVTSLEQAVVLAQSQGLVAEVAAAGWLLAIALAAAGRYGGALTVLGPLMDAEADTSPERHALAALAGSTAASIHRQLGRHAVAREVDLAALALTDGTGEGAFDALLGLASDAVGLDEGAEAAARLAEAERALPGQDEQWWRQQVRLGWAGAEVALLEGRAEQAAARAAEAVQRAERAQAPRHVAKGLLLLGLTQVATGSWQAVQTLRRCATIAESLDALPLIWPSRALLGALLGETGDPAEQEESEQSLAAAGSAVLAIAADLPPEVRSAWLSRPDVAALLRA